jgi:hypothetical protein
MTRFPARPVDVDALDHEEFVFVLHLSDAASRCRIPVPHTTPTVHMSDGVHHHELRLQDGLGPRMFVAVCDHFGDDANRAAVWLLRFWALQALKADPRMVRWVRAASVNWNEVYEGVFEAAATQPLNERWEFNAEDFFSTVEALDVSGKYRD